MNKFPHIIKFNKLGDPSLGYISVAEIIQNVPFPIKRVYWTYYTPQDVTRGGHAHKNLHQIIFAVSGTITFTVENLEGVKKKFILDSPEKGLSIPPMIWRDIKFSHNAVLLCLASEIYDEEDYFRDYNDFKNFESPEAISFVEYDELVLQQSWGWLNDPEIKKLTATPDFTEEQQKKWFSNLKVANDYFVRGIKYGDEIIGVVGIKNIEKTLKKGEYFGYIGEKKYWGKGLSIEILSNICFIAKNDLKLETLCLNVSTENIRAMRAYENFGFRIIKISDNNVEMNYRL